MPLDFEEHQTATTQCSLPPQDAESVVRHGTTRKGKSHGENETLRGGFERNEDKKRKLAERLAKGGTPSVPSGWKMT